MVARIKNKKNGICIRYLAASNGDSSGDTSFRLSGRSSSSSSSDRSASGKNHPPLTRATSMGSSFVSRFVAHSTTFRKTELHEAEEYFTYMI